MCSKGILDQEPRDFSHERFRCNEVDGENISDEKWEKKIVGMKIYNSEEIEDYLSRAGFVDIQIKRRKKKNSLCITAKRPN